MGSERNGRSARLIVLMTGLAAAASARGDDFLQSLQVPHADWSLFAGATETDNAQRQPQGSSDTIAVAGVSGDLYRDSGRFKTDIDASLRFEDYLHKTFTDHVLGSLVGMAAYAFIPEKLTWVVQDSYGQVNANPTLPTTPLTRVNVNALSTGPDAYLNFTGATGLQLGARYAQSDYQNNPYVFAQPDNRQVSGNVGLIHKLSTLSSVSLNYSDARVEYRVDGNPHYDQQELFVRFESKTVRSGISLDAGVGDLKETGQDVKSPVLRLTLYRQLTPSWSLNLGGASEFRNAAQAFQAALAGVNVVNGQVVPTGGAGNPGPGGTVGDVILTRSTFRSDSANLALDFLRPRTNFDLHASASREHYEFGGSGLDRDIVGGSVGVGRKLTPNLSMHLSGSYERRTPQSPAAAQLLVGDRTTLADAGVDWRAGALLAITLSYHREDRQTDAGGFAYLENRVYLGFTYGPERQPVTFRPPGAPAVDPAAPPPGQP